MKKFFLMAGFLLFSPFALSDDRTICKNQDDRFPSFDKKIARVINQGARSGCSMTLIGRTCAISAGHCFRRFEIAEFDVPRSQGGKIVNSTPENVYLVDRSSVVSRNGGIGNDYAVFRLLPHAITGQYAGDERGWYRVSYNTPKVGDTVSITGYGSDRNDPQYNYIQQYDNGKITSLSGATLQHQVDTMGGNSGSSIYHKNSRRVIGIHTHGGCGTFGGSNSSTLIAGNQQLQNAIRSCLAWEQNNL